MARILSAAIVVMVIARPVSAQPTLTIEDASRLLVQPQPEPKPWPSVGDALRMAAPVHRPAYDAAGRRIVGLYIGPDTRDGFADVDRGILDSINDLRAEFKRVKQLRIVDTTLDADVVVAVLSRGLSGHAGTIAAPIGGTLVVLPYARIGLATAIRTPRDEHAFGVPIRIWLTAKTINPDRCESWRSCAKLVARDVATWIDANRARLLQKP